MTLPIVRERTDIFRRSTVRFFDTETKRRIVGEWNALESHSPERGSLLRRKGIVRRQIYEWRQPVEMKPEHKRGPGQPPNKVIGRR